METSRYASRLSAQHRAVELQVDEGSRLALAPASQRFTPCPNSFSLMDQEPDDAKITGGTRSLSRRLLALNVPSASLSGRAQKQKMKKLHPA